MLPNPIRYHLCAGQPLPDPWPYDYVVDANGILKRASTPYFDARLRVASARVAGLDYAGGPPLTLRVPKIPAKWLDRVLEHARRAGQGASVLRPIEQMYHFHWTFPDLPAFDPSTEREAEKTWRVSIPRQQAGAARVQYRGGSEASVVLDLHSHHVMPAYFSEVDDRDEQGCRLYAVIGRIYERPEICVRVGLYGDFLEIAPGLVFEESQQFFDWS